MKPSESTKVVYSCVRKIINSAALCVEIGEYERAIASLGKALKISRSFIEGNKCSKNDTDRDGEKTEESSSASSEDTSMVGETETANSCYHNHLCSLDECIHFSEDQHRNSHIHRTLRSMAGVRGATADNQKEETIRKRFIQRREQRRAKSSDNYNSSSSSNSDNHCSSSSNFFYMRLIQVPSLSDHRCRSICLKQIANLSLLSIFNLAVVYHLRAMDRTSYRSNGDSSRSNCRGHQSQAIDLHKALNLYGIVYTVLEEQYHGETRRTSVQFGLILCNNLSHVHNLVGNRNKHERYLREVLSSVMSLIDSSQRPWNNHHHQESDKRRSHPWCIDLEGFLDNAAPLVTEMVCAEAA